METTEEKVNLLEVEHAESEPEVPRASSGDAPAAKNQKSDVMASTISEIVPLRARKAGGPSTKIGKERSRRNAVKHGIFAKVVVLEKEPGAQFDSLLQGFRNDLRPEGMVEEILVEKLACLTWRYRRMLVAERAEIHVEQCFSSRVAARQERDRQEALILATSESAPNFGRYARWQNPMVRELCVKQLRTLHYLISMRGFNPTDDSEVINRCFGLPERIQLVSLYNFFSNPNERVRKEAGSQFDLPKEKCQDTYLAFLGEMIEKLEHFDDMTKAIGQPHQQQRLEKVSANVPESARLDRLLKYSASLERDFDRTLNQLERLQRIRTGQPVPAQPNVNI